MCMLFTAVAVAAAAAGYQLQLLLLLGLFEWQPWHEKQAPCGALHAAAAQADQQQQQPVGVANNVIVLQLQLPCSNNNNIKSSSKYVEQLLRTNKGTNDCRLRATCGMLQAAVAAAA